MSTEQRPRRRAVRTSSPRQRGQAAALVGLLIFFVVLGVAALAVDVGTNFDNQQQMQGAADAAALAGAQSTGFPGAGVRQSTEQLAWTNLGLTPPSGSCATGTSSSGTTCTELEDGYTVTVTYPYTPFNTTVNDYPANEVVAVDITHHNPAHGFEGFLGISSTTIDVHAAAVGVAGSRQFPFALATRFLDLTGGGSITAYGSTLVDQCSDGGLGDFSSGGGANGGLYENGTTSLLIGGDYTSSSLSYNADAEAVLAADPGTTSCGATANSSASDFSGFSHLVHFSSTNPDYNFAYGFNSGPPGCSAYSSQSFPAPCQSDPEGDGQWQDPSCWQLPGGKGTVPVGWTNGYAYQQGQGVMVVPATAAPVMCGTTPIEASPPEPTGTLEGSYYPYQFPGFPLYQTPSELVQELPPYLSIPSTPESGITAISGSGGGSPGYTSTGGDWSFQAGVYVIDGASALPTIKNNQSFSCLSDGKADEYPNGCVFIFMNGASLNITGSGSSLNCNYLAGDPSPTTYAPCSFFFADSTDPSSSTFSLSSGVNGNLDPIPYSLGSGSSLFNFPVVYSNGTSTTGPTTSLSKSAVVSLSNPGTFAFNGTIYVPHGIFSSNANADSSSGQVIADSIRLQGGANSSSGVAYNGAAVAPVIGSSHLIE